MATLLLLLTIIFGSPHPLPACSTDIECEEMFGPEPELREIRDC